MNHPRITLLSVTQNIELTMGFVWQIAKEKTPLSQIRALDVNVDDILTADLPTAEYINFIWCVEGMPRAFWDQFDRTRHAAFWEQSIRILDLTHFATKGEYWMPDSVDKAPLAKIKYMECMHAIQTTYNKLIQLGIPTEEARGVLPLHILTRGTCCINLRALRQLISNRVCFIAQGSYWLPVVHGMMLELAKVLPSKTFKSMAHLPCYGKNHCPIASNVAPRLTGEDPNPPCPVYMKRFQEGHEAEVYRLHPEYDKIKEKYYELIRTLGMDE